MFPRTIRVAVVHDNFLTCAGLTATFAARGDMAVQALLPQDGEVLRCDVVVADLQCGMDILDAAREMPPALRPRVAIVSASDGEREIREALRRGAAAYLLQGACGEELVAAVHTVCEGGHHLSHSISARLAESLSAQSLTAREEGVLALVMEGLCNKRIATRLDISVGTVKTHLRSAFSKLHVRSRTEAVATARRRGIVRQLKQPAKADVSQAVARTGDDWVPAAASVSAHRFATAFIVATGGLE
jgi:DNA-binding NarL/FixJ family response regulator